VPYEIDEEYYWSAPEILINDRYVGKRFTKSEKYIIYIVLLSDDNALSNQCIADICNVDRKTIASKLSDIREVLEEIKYEVA
jgi:transcriptional antiterminator